MCVCVCVCVFGGGGEGAHLTSSDRLTSPECLDPISVDKNRLMHSGCQPKHEIRHNHYMKNNNNISNKYFGDTMYIIFDLI